MGENKTAACDYCGEELPLAELFTSRSGGRFCEDHFAAHGPHPMIENGGYEFRGMRIPAHMLDSLRRYIEDGIPRGGFLTAVLENDLREACGRADDDNMRIIPAYVAYLYNEAPAACWGSPEKVKAWIHAPTPSGRGAVVRSRRPTAR